MNYPELLETVQKKAALDRDGAEAATVATIRALAERVTSEETQNLLSELPKALQDRIPVTAKVEDLSLDEFFERISRLEGVPVDQACDHARTVVGVLRDAVSAGEMRDIFTQLPPSYIDLLT